MRRALPAPGVAVVLVAMALAAAFACTSEDEPARSNGAQAEDPLLLYRTDPHLALLLRECPPGQRRFYDRDTSRMLPVLIEKLQIGQMEPLRRAMEELGAGGDPAAEELRRLFESHYASLFDTPYVENALSAASLSDSEVAREMLLRGLEHPQETVRKKSLMGLVARHLRPADFDVLAQHVGGIESAALSVQFALALHTADAERAELAYAHWLRDGEHEELKHEVVALLAGSELAEVAEICGELYAKAPKLMRSSLAAPAARAGDEAALELLLTELVSEEPRRRTVALVSLNAAGFIEEQAVALRSDENSHLRLLAAEQIAQAETTPERIVLLKEALEDLSQPVRGRALHLLVEKGDAEAIDRAILYLGEPSPKLQAALTALRTPITVDPSLARRVYERLLERYAAETHRPLQQRSATFKAMGIVPLVEAARFLHEIAVASDGELIEGLPAHNWILIQAANTGSVGRAWLFERFVEERDPARRLDLLWSVGSAREAEAREALLAVAEKHARSPYEILFAAGLLVKIGPSHAVAPRLKRVCYAMETAEVRVALQCLLWKWY